MKIKFRIRPDFRREQFLKGIDVQSECEMECPASVISEVQRQFILDFYKNLSKGLPEVLELEVPSFVPNHDDPVDFPWYGYLDPSTHELGDVLDAWITDYNSAKMKAEEEARNYTPPETYLNTQAISRTR